MSINKDQAQQLGEVVDAAKMQNDLDPAPLVGMENDKVTRAEWQVTKN